MSFSDFGLKRLSAAPTDKSTRYFQHIKQSGQELLGLVNDLLNLAELESGNTTYTYESVNLSRLFGLVIDEFEPQAADRQLSFVTDFPASPLDVCLDPEKVKQVIRNLLSNAVKFSTARGAVTCHLSQQTATVLVGVCDEGIGIPEDELHAIFDKFVQSSKTRTGAGGTGLGLAICWEIVKTHGGRIWAENGPQGGAVFYVEFPLNMETDHNVSSHAAS